MSARCIAVVSAPYVVLCPDVPSASHRMCARDVRDVQAEARMSRAHARWDDLFSLGPWDNGTERGCLVIDVKEQAGIAMNVRSQFSDPIVDPKLTLGALAFADELGRLLWRMKYGQDIRRVGMKRAILLLANRIRRSGKFNRGKFTGLDRIARRDSRAGRRVDREQTDILERFAQRVIVEWVVDQCQKCEGRGVIGRSEEHRQVRLSEQQCAACNGRRVICVHEERIPFAARSDGLGGPLVYRDYERCPVCSGRGKIVDEPEMQRVGRQICPTCNGSGRRPVNEPARALALGVSLDLYRNNWARYFHVVLAMLDAVDGSAADTVRRQVRA